MSYSYDHRPSTARYSYDQRTALSRPSAHGDPVKEALSNGWDAMEEFVKTAENVGSTMADLQEDPVDPKLEKMGRQLFKLARKIDQQSKSWRGPFNLWLEGRQVDHHRLANDLGATIALITDAMKLPDPKNWETPHMKGHGTLAIQLFHTAIAGLKK